MKLNLASLTPAIVLAAFISGSGVRAQDTNRAGPRDFSAFKIISERNIFDPNRRPRINNMPQTPRPVDSFALAGTMSYDQGQFAVFDGTSSEYHKVLGVDGKIAGYSITQIGHDSVKLVSTTNEITLKVGMQMRRSPDGKWSASASEPSYAFNSGAGSGSRSRWSRSDRRSDYGHNDHRTDEHSATAQPDDGGPPDAGAPPDIGPGMDAAPPDAGNLDPNDPVAQMILRRQRELNGGAPQPGNQSGENNPNSNTGGNAAAPPAEPPPNDNPNPNQ